MTVRTHLCGTSQFCACQWSLDTIAVIETATGHSNKVIHGTNLFGTTTPSCCCGQSRTATLRGTGHVVTDWTKANHQANPIGHSQPSVNFMTPACSSVTQTMWPLTCSYCVNKGQQNCSDSVIKHIGQLNILILGPSGSRSPNTGQSTSVKLFKLL